MNKIDHGQDHTVPFSLPLEPKKAMSYQNQGESLAEKLRLLDEENTRLRNSVLNCNDEIYSLKAVAATVEAELKYNTEQELANMESELKFKSNDLAKLSRDYEKVLKELAGMKQAQAMAKRAPKQEPAQDVMDYGDYGFEGGGSQQNGIPSQNTTHTSVTPVHHDHASKEKHSAAQVKQAAVPHKAVVELESVKAVPGEKKLSGVTSSAPPVEKGSDAVSVASSSRSSNSRTTENAVINEINNTEPLGSSARMVQVLSTLFQQAVLRHVPSLNGRVSSSGREGPTTEQSLLQAVSSSIGKCAQETCEDRDSCDLSPLNEAAISLCSHLLETTASQPSSSSGLPCALESCLAMVDASMQHSIAQMGRLARRDVEAAGQEGLGEAAAVAGNLQSKFELAADPTAIRDASTAAPNSAVAKGAKRVSTSRVLCALRTPYLAEAQRQAAWTASAEEQGASLAKFGATRRSAEQIASIQHSIGRYVAVLEEVLCVVVPQSGSLDAHSSLLLQCARAWGRLYSALIITQSSITAVEREVLSNISVRRGLFDRVLHLLCADGASDALRGNVVLAMQSFLTFSHRGFDALCVHQLRRQPGHHSRAARHASDKKETDKGGGEATKTMAAGRTDALLHVLVAQLVNSSHNFSLTYRLQIVIFLENLLARFGSRFVLLILGLDASTTIRTAGVNVHSAAAGEGSAGKKRPRAESGDNKGPGRNVSSKQHSLSAIGGGGVVQNTPSNARKSGGGGGDGGGAAGAAGAGNRITPTTHPSASRSGRKLTPPTPGGGTLDLQPQLGQVQRDVVSDLVLCWMRLIRSLDISSSRHGTSTEANLVVALIMRLSFLLAGILCHLSSQDCDLVLCDVPDTFHEYIYRSNTSSWSPLLKMPESLFTFLESHRNTDSMG